MFSFLKRLFFGSDPLDINVKAETVPEALGYPEKEYSILVNELTHFIQPSERLSSFKSYIENPLFEKFKLDLHNPRHAAIIGYAFCSAVMLQSNLRQTNIANEVLRNFYPQKGDSDKKVN